MSDDIAARKRLTFAQAEGASPLPIQLDRTTVSPGLKAAMWALVYDSIFETISHFSYSPWRQIARRKFITVDHRPADEFRSEFSNAIQYLKPDLNSTDYIKFYGIVQFLVRQPELPPYLRKSIPLVLEMERSPYRLIDGDTLVPIGSDEEASSLVTAFADLSAADLQGGSGRATFFGELRG
jgi:hypothetical protein